MEGSQRTGVTTENSNPLAVFAMAAQGTQIHVEIFKNNRSRHFRKTAAIR